MKLIKKFKIKTQQERQNKEDQEGNGKQINNIGFKEQRQKNEYRRGR